MDKCQCTVGEFREQLFWPEFRKHSVLMRNKKGPLGYVRKRGKHLTE